MSDSTQGITPERLQPSGLVRRFLNRDKTPVSVLLLSALVGLLAGLIGTLFEMGLPGFQSREPNGYVMKSAVHYRFGSVLLLLVRFWL